MSTRELRKLLDGVPDTRELVLRRGALAGPRDPTHEAWRDAREESERALRAWLAAPGQRLVYATYRAAQDREDAALDALLQAHRDCPRAA